jgi:hypothetical protein
MAFGAQPLDSNNIPISSGYSIADTAFRAIQSGKSFTDASSNASAPIRMELTPGSKATYAAAIANNAAYATPTDVFMLVGSATKLVKVTRVYICSAATSAGSYITHFIKRTAANTAGTKSTITTAQLDSADGAGTAVASNYTVVPTGLGAGVDVYAFRMIQSTLTGSPVLYIFDFSSYGGEPVVLHGVAECFSVNFGGVALPSGSVFDFSIFWTEE